MDGVGDVSRGGVVWFERMACDPPPVARTQPEWSSPRGVGLARRLADRDRLLRRLRATFRRRDFVEVETPSLLRAPGQEPHLQPLEVSWLGRPHYLATSPEYAMKRLLGLGVSHSFQLGRAWRGGRDEVSTLHQPEFTLLEWYRAWGTLDDLRDDLAALLEATCRSLSGGTVAVRGGVHCDLGRRPEWVTVSEAFDRFAQIDLEPYLDGAWDTFLDSLAVDDRGDEGTLVERAEAAFHRLLVRDIEPNLGAGAPTLLTAYPARHAALAELDDADPRTARRFELYVAGLELANAFQELRDPVEQERRLRAEQAERVAGGGAALPLCEEFVAALGDGLPPAAGIALGVDRLHLVVTGADSIEDVVAFPHQPPEDSSSVA